MRTSTSITGTSTRTPTTVARATGDDEAVAPWVREMRGEVAQEGDGFAAGEDVERADEHRAGRADPGDLREVAVRLRVDVVERVREEPVACGVGNARDPAEQVERIAAWTAQVKAEAGV